MSVKAATRLLTLEQVGQRLGKTAQAVRMMIYRNELTAIRIGKRGLRIEEAVLEEYIQRLQPVYRGEAPRAKPRAV